MSKDWVTSRVEGQILFVSLNRPEKRNALAPDMVEDLASAICTADEHPEVRAVIVRGEGPIFSAGVDIMSLAQSQADTAGRNPARSLRRLAERLQAALARIENTEVPVIGAMHGQVLGLGLEMALALDFRVAASDLKLAFPEARLGLVADVGGTTRLCRLVGPSRAKDMLMTARTLDAQEALSWGLVNRVAAPNEVLDNAVALAEQIAANAPLAVGLTKWIVDQGEGLEKSSHMAFERLAQSQLITTTDVAEAMAAFMEKRPPRFEGK